MCRLSKLSARWMGELGFSIGITDVTPADILNERKGAAIDKGNAECDEYITAFNRGKLDLLPGCNEIQTLEVRLTPSHTLPSHVLPLCKPHSTSSVRPTVVAVCAPWRSLQWCVMYRPDGVAALPLA